MVSHWTYAMENNVIQSIVGPSHEHKHRRESRDILFLRNGWVKCFSNVSMSHDRPFLREKNDHQLMWFIFEENLMAIAKITRSDGISIYDESVRMVIIRLSSVIIFPFTAQLCSVRRHICIELPNNGRIKWKHKNYNFLLISQLWIQIWK